MKWLIYAAFAVFSMAANADEKQSGLLTLTQPEFHDQVVSQGCGYWDERQVRVCDYRTVLVNEPYTACHYNRTYASNPALFPTTVTTTHGPQHNCQYTITHGAPGMSPHATYHLRSSEQLTRQVERTEEYNCRMESRMVWVELPNCNANPRVQSQQPLSSNALTWQYATAFNGSTCPTGSIPASAPLSSAGSACSSANSMARTNEATTSHWHGAGPTCYKALQCQ
ncbi:hypothetical protein MN202_10235 [Rheinheimera muenzenbergensis]|uniref:Secreted protein n=1 Tax=Rheinheimera muenzenbergensis TaxID=1193628 RepID=A0ABU8C757_9GAMM